MAGRWWLTSTTLVLGLLALGAAYLAQVAGDGIPFAPVYHPRHDLLEWVTLVGAGYLALGCAVALRAERRIRARVLAGQLGLLLTGAAGYLAYHLHHAHHRGTTEVMGWDALEPVTAFHQQLAAPLLVALVVAPVISIVAAACDRSPPR